MAGWTGYGEECTACIPGTFKQAEGSMPCNSCPSNSTSPALSTTGVACTCVAGYEGSVVYEHSIVENHVKTLTDKDGWRLVRYLPAGAANWHPVDDELVGTVAYSDGNKAIKSGSTRYTASEHTTGSFSLVFEDEVPGYDEFFFSTVDSAHWLYCTRAAVSFGFEGLTGLPSGGAAMTTNNNYLLERTVFDSSALSGSGYATSPNQAGASRSFFIMESPTKNKNRLMIYAADKTSWDDVREERWVYMENAEATLGPGKGSMVFVRDSSIGGSPAGTINPLLWYPFDGSLLNYGSLRDNILEPYTVSGTPLAAAYASTPSITTLSNVLDVTAAGLFLGSGAGDWKDNDFTMTK